MQRGAVCEAVRSVAFADVFFLEEVAVVAGIGASVFDFVVPEFRRDAVGECFAAAAGALDEADAALALRAFGLIGIVGVHVLADNDGTDGFAAKTCVDFILD